MGSTFVQNGFEPSRDFRPESVNSVQTHDNIAYNFVEYVYYINMNV